MVMSNYFSDYIYTDYRHKKAFTAAVLLNFSVIEKTSLFSVVGKSHLNCTIYTRRKKVGHLNIKTKMASEYSQRVFASQPIRTRASELFLC